MNIYIQIVLGTFYENLRICLCKGGNMELREVLMELENGDGR